MFYSLGKAYFRTLAEIFDTHSSLVYRWAVEAFEKSQQQIDDSITEIEFDEMWHFIKKKNKLWLIKALDRATVKTIAWVLEKQDTQTFRQLYDKVKYLNKCTFYTDNWDTFVEVLPKQRHLIGKKYTTEIERDNIFKNSQDIALSTVLT